MKKLLNKNVINSDLEAKFKEIITEQEVYNFLTQNNIEMSEAIKYLAEFEMYQQNTSKYELAVESLQIVLKEKKDRKNEGIYYLDEAYFYENKLLNNIDYKENQTKLQIVKEFLNNQQQGLTLVGANGVGKTTLIVALANYKYQEQNKKTLFVFWPDFIEKTKRFKEDNIYFINKVKYAPNLIIDDLGQEAITPWSRDDVLHPIISYRLEKKLPTYISTNYLLEELEKIYTFRTAESKKTKSIIEKLKSLTKIYEIRGKNLRVKE